MTDRTRPLKLETPEEGGSSTDFFPTETDPNEDFVDCRGISLQNDTSNDDSVLISRDNYSNMTFKDPVVGATYTLTSLVSGGFDINSVVWDNQGCIVFDNSDQAVTRS